MSISNRNAIAENFGRTAMSELGKAIRAEFGGRFEIALGAVCLAAAFSVLDGYPRLAALSVVSLCSFASMMRQPE
jgi:hypothetical protein